MPKLFIGNIPHASTDVELHRWVESHGFPVELAQVIYDRTSGKSRGFGFVTLGEGENLEAAVTVLNGKRMSGRSLTVSEAVPLSTQPAPPRIPQRDFANKPHGEAKPEQGLG